ncbi:MAG: hypothetical protein V7634_4769 [Bradyrhizobium sp.]
MEGAGGECLVAQLSRQNMLSFPRTRGRITIVLTSKQRKMIRGLSNNLPHDVSAPAFAGTRASVGAAERS